MASALETLCGQAFGAKTYHMLGIYLQRSWIVLLLCCFLLLPVYIFASQILKLLEQTYEVAEQTGLVAVLLIPLHFSFAFQFPLQRFLQCQLKNQVIAWVAVAGLVVNALTSWLSVYVLDFGVVGAAVALDISWWFTVLGLFVYSSCGWCPLTWSGFTMQAFYGLGSLSSTLLPLDLENWYYRILILMTGYLKDATIAVDALSVCMSINVWELKIPLAFFAGTGVRVANELGAGNGKAAKFATKVSVAQSHVVRCPLSFLLAITILLNNVQPILSGVAVGCGWQAWVAYINLGCYHIVGLPLGILMGRVFKLGVTVDSRRNFLKFRILENL
ncbi:Multi antimicrobial extrusion protein [Parasponia andersonii]|uniref:Multi antimicrobial extrusion protein n=1 Tax=Parasponia andersonii TaxID=3476 RepID=A0A2P5BDK5_PARAD|nr:Multi antimicrobial extrusion protein [Parasponia andersonii]